MSKEIIIGTLVILFIVGIIIYFKESEKFENIKARPVKPTTTSFFPSYWYKYDTSDTRSKCLSTYILFFFQFFIIINIVYFDIILQ
jgi:hypothetical protein